MTNPFGKPGLKKREDEANAANQEMSDANTAEDTARRGFKENDYISANKRSRDAATKSEKAFRALARQRALKGN